MDAFERGDHQTPRSLTRRVLKRLARDFEVPACVLEPTCGRGHFLSAARELGVQARVGYELDPARLAQARDEDHGAQLHARDFFELDWPAILAPLPSPLWIVGNPPWVTSAALSAHASDNVPRTREHSLRGLDAITGASNFDLAEYIFLQLLDALGEREATLALLIKSSTARRLLTQLASRARGTAHALIAIDTRREFGVSVDASLLVITNGPTQGRVRTGQVRCPRYASLEAEQERGALIVEEGLVRESSDLDAPRWTLPPLDWRSGVKHDCADVFELRRKDDAWVNGLGEEVDLESEHVFPLLKCTDLARDREASRAVITPQRRVGQETTSLPPKLMAYLEAHGERLDARKSRVYRGRPRFSIFGVGDYSFAPYKIAVSGLHRSPSFRLISPHEERPVLLDDTCYFAPFDEFETAQRAHSALEKPGVQSFLSAHIFPGQKRPVTKRLLKRLS